MADDVLLRDDNIPPIQEELFRLYSQGFVTDITLSCEDGKIFEAHKVILSARSNYFYGLIPKLKGDPVIFLKGIKGAYLEKVLKYVYSGSALVPRSQLRSLFEVARALQIKGLLELAACSESRMAGPGVAQSSPRPPGSGATANYCGKGGELSPLGYGGKSLREAKEAALQQQQKLYDMYSSTASKGNKSSAKGSQTYDTGLQVSPSSKSGRLSSTARTVKDISEGHEEEAFKFQYKHISDDSDDAENNDATYFEHDNDGKLSGQRLGAGQHGVLKRRRDKVSKILSAKQKVALQDSRSSSDDDSDTSDDTLDEALKKEDDLSGSSDSDSDSDNSDLDSDESVPAVPKSAYHGRKSDHLSRKKEPSPSLDDYDIPSAASPQRRSQRGVGVGNQQVLSIQCKGKRAQLHVSKFCSGSKGKSICYKNQWMTPDDYEKECGGGKVKRFLDSITTDYGPLRTLSVSGVLKIHTKKCRCISCADQTEDSETNQQTKSVRSMPQTERVADMTGREKFDKLSESKRKKSETLEPPKKSKVARVEVELDPPAANRPTAGQQSDCRSESIPVAGTSGENLKTTAVKPSADVITKNPTPTATSSPSSFGSSSAKNSAAKLQLVARSTEAMTPATTAVTTTTSSSSVNSVKMLGPPAAGSQIVGAAVTTTTVSSFSPSSSSDSLSSPTFLALSSGSPQISPATTLGSPVVPVPSRLSGIPSPQQQQLTRHLPLVTAPSFVATITTTTTAAPNAVHNTIVAQPKLEKKPATNVLVSTMKPQFALQMGPPPKVETSVVTAAGTTAVTTTFEMAGMQHQMPRSRLSAVMQVRCKAISAYLYVSKYESGSKGKCILLGEEWLTPNEFEEKSGSKAKKYLSSIKCLGRPLRAFVNSGELRGSTPPSPKPPRMNKPKTIQPIAPAPAQGHHNQISLAQIGMSPAGASLTPMAMVGSMSMAGQPILISQASSMQQAQLGTPILAPMTFTLAPMTTTGIEVRHGMGAAVQTQQQQQHQHQHQQQQQQLHHQQHIQLQHQHQLHHQHQQHEQQHHHHPHQQQQQQHHGAHQPPQTEHVLS